jgi:type II secretory pathway pseudopilin PulG
MDNSLRVSSFITFGWETFKKRGWFFVLATLILYFLSALLTQFITGILSLFLPSTFAIDLGSFINLVVSLLLAMGWTALSLKASDDVTTVSLSDFWHPQNFWKYLGMYILYLLAIGVGFIFFIVPGIIAMCAFIFAPYFVIDKGLGPIEALKASARITKGHRLRILAFIGATFLLAFLGIVLLVVGILVAAPVTAIATARAYRSFSAAADANQPHQTLSGGETILMIVSLIIPVIAVVGIIAAIVLVSLSNARMGPGGLQASTELSYLQNDLELYKSDNGTYPTSLSDLSSDPKIAYPLKLEEEEFSLNDFTYMQLQGGTDYQLCSQTLATYLPPTGAETNSINPCVNSPDDTTSTSSDMQYPATLTSP